MTTKNVKHQQLIIQRNVSLWISIGCFGTLVALNVGKKGLNSNWTAMSGLCGVASGIRAIFCDFKANQNKVFWNDLSIQDEVPKW